MLNQINHWVLLKILKMSNWLQNILSGLSPKNKEEEVVSYSEKISRDEIFWKEYKHGKFFTNEYLEVLKPLVINKTISNQSEIPGVILDTPYAKGVIFYRNDVDSNDLFQWVFENIRERTISLGYYLTNSKKEVQESITQKKEKEVYYLKPEIKIQEDVYIHDQKYGQILIEHYIEDNESKMIKILATYYSGRQYSEPLEFNELINKILVTD